MRIGCVKGVFNPQGGAVCSVVGDLPCWQADLLYAKLRAVFQPDLLICMRLDLTLISTGGNKSY